MKSRDALSFSDGIATIYKRDAADGDGDLPDYPEMLNGSVTNATVRCQLRFRDKKVGITRYYAALSEDIQIDRVITVLLNTTVSRFDYVVIGGEIYTIRQIQRTIDKNPLSMDLSLERIFAI